MITQPLGDFCYFVLDREGLVKWCAADQRVTAFVREGQDNDFRVVVSAMTPIEAQDVRAKSDRLGWHLSRLRIEPVTEDISALAIELLRDARPHGHQYAVDAVVAATALRSVRPVIVLTSDEDDMRKLCGKAVQVVGVSHGLCGVAQPITSPLIRRSLLPGTVTPAVALGLGRGGEHLHAARLEGAPQVGWRCGVGDQVVGSS